MEKWTCTAKGPAGMQVPPPLGPVAGFGVHRGAVPVAAASEAGLSLVNAAISLSADYSCDGTVCR